MNSQRKRLFATTLAVAGVVVLALGVSQGSARTSAKIQSLRRTIELHKTTCDDTSNGQVGIAKLDYQYNTKKGRLENVMVNMTQGLPSTTYTFYLLDGSCNVLAVYPKSYTSKGNGRLRLDLTFNVTGTVFALDAWDGSTNNISKPADFS